MLLGTGMAAALAAGFTSGLVETAHPKRQPGAQSAASPEDLIDNLRKKLAAGSEELAQTTTGGIEPSSTDVASQAEVIERRLLLQQLVRTYQRQIDSLFKLQQLQQDRTQLERQTANWAGFPNPPPYSFLKVDEFRQSVQSLNARIQALATLSSAIEQEIDRREDMLEKSGEKLRQANERLEKSSNANDIPRLTWLRDLEALRNRLAEARLAGTQVEQKFSEAELAETRQQLDFTRRQLSEAKKHIAFSAADRDHVRKDLEAERRRLQAELDETLPALESSRKVLDKATESLSRERETIAAGADPSRLAELERNVELQREQVENADIKFQALNRLLDANKAQGDLWELRWSLADSWDADKVRQAYERIATAQRELKPIKEFLEQRMKLVSDLVFGLESRLQDPSSPRQMVQDQKLRDLYTQREGSYRRALRGFETTAQLLGLWKQDMDDRRQTEPWSDRFFGWLVEVRHSAAQVWQFELFAVQDTIEVDGQEITGKRSVTIGKIVKALLILVVGLWIAAFLSRLMERLAVTRAGVDASHARIGRRWLLFVLGATLLITSLEMVKIPLTAFAFMGGAVAIGAGFGMQNLLKNLISGLMLLLERPFRPGDLVEVGSIRGRVMDIGMRSSHIRDANGIETLIPNSTFIEENVTNWTLSSQSVRITVKVGVAYGSPVQEVADLLLEAAQRHGLVQDKPQPQVLFEDFGSDALLFGLYVWVELKPEVDWRTVASDLRHMINKAMTSHGIVIAYPQRDIHLDSDRPLEVRLVANAPTDDHFALRNE